MSAPEKRSHFCLILSSPSGAGKTTLARRLLAEDGTLVPSISVTTRPMRPGETNGSDYIFVTPEMFASMRDRGDFLEWAEVFGNLYGTPASGVNAALAADKDVVFDIDWQGARAVREALPGVAVSVFILPPSREELVRRIRGRASEPEDVIQRRLAGAAEEISHWDEYDYVLVNRDVDESVRALHSILAAERLKRSRQPALGELVRGLQQRS